MIKRNIILFSLQIIFSFIYVGHSFAEDKRNIKIASGDLLEGYYYLGLELCDYISSSNNNITCEVVPTTGAIENLKLLQEGKVDFAFSLSNIAQDAYYGKGSFDGNPFDGMYQLIKLYDKYFTVIVKDDDKILLFSDLDGKKLSNGPSNSDSSVIYQKIRSGFNFKNNPTDIEILYEDYAKEFCNSDVDAIILMTEHPNPLVNMITHSCESDFLSINSNKIDLILNNNYGFEKGVIKAEHYPGITREEKTIKVSSIFLASKLVEKELIDNFMNHFTKKIDKFISVSPALKGFSKDNFFDKLILPDSKNSNVLNNINYR